MSYNIYAEDCDNPVPKCGPHRVLEINKSNTKNNVGFGREVELNSSDTYKYCGWVNGPLVHGERAAEKYPHINKDAPVGTIVDNGRIISGGSGEIIKREEDTKIPWVNPSNPDPP